MTIRALGMPWGGAGERQYCLPTSLLVKLAPGEVPDHLPALRDVAHGLATAAGALDGGPIDRVLGAHAGAFRAARLFGAASDHGPGYGHCGYDTLEHSTGLSRSLLLRVPLGTPIGALCEMLAQLPSVERASPNYVAANPLDMPPALHGAAVPGARGGLDPRAMVRMAEAHAIEPGDDGVVVGLIDSGIARHHPEFAHTFRAGADLVRIERGDMAPGVQLLSDPRPRGGFPEDRFVGHGMGCAGIIGADGVAMPRGLGGACRILPMRALAAARLPGKAAAVGLGAISDLDRALKRAVDLGAKVINMSFGTDDAALAPSSPRPHADTIAYASARGCILVAASGNNGHVTRYWPAAFPEVIAVGAVAGDGCPTVFSTRGEHVALCAPGEAVLTAALNGYQQATGTSFAAPFVAGAAALLVAWAERHALPLDGAMVRRLLVASAQPFAAGDHAGCGAGILDAAAALAALVAEADPANPGGGADDG